MRSQTEFGNEKGNNVKKNRTYGAPTVESSALFANFPLIVWYKRTMPLLTPLELDLALRDLPEWEVESVQLRKVFEFETYAKGLLFIVALGFFAEKMDHHPDILLTWRKVMVSFTTHSEGGITERDVAMAKICEELYKVP